MTSSCSSVSATRPPFLATRSLSFARKPLVIALLGLAAGSVTIPQAALAQTATPAVEQIHNFDVPAGPLDAALDSFARAAGVNLTYDAALVSDKRSPGLSGNHGIASALTLLLAGSGLEAVAQPGGGYLLRRSAAEAAVTLVPVKVRATAESGRGPVEGIVARRSITATKSDTPLVETPQSISVVTAEQIEIQNAESLAQAFKYTPGVVPMGSDNTTSDGMVIRGFNVTGSAPIYLNGTKMKRNTFSGVSEPYGLERAELLRGPASVLYGNAAPGGIINMVSKLPQQQSAHEVKVQGGSFDRRQIAGDSTGSLTDDGVFSYRVTGLVRRSDTMVDYIPDDRDFAAASVTWRPSETTSLTLLANYQHNDTLYNYGLPENGTVLPNQNGNIDQERFVGEPDFNNFETRNYTLGYLFSHRFSDDLEFRQNLLHFDSTTDYADVWIGALDATQRSVSRGAYARSDDDGSWTLDNQLEYHWQWGVSEHTTLVGVDYSENEFSRVQYNGAVAALDLFTPQYGSQVTLGDTPALDYREESSQLGIYVQEQIKLDERWVVMLGGRHDSMKSDEFDRPSATSSDLYDDTAFTGRAGLVYLFDNGFAPYISYAQSFEPASGRDFNQRPFEPTEGEQYEMGVRYLPEGAALSATLSVYQLTQSNVSTPDLAHPGNAVQEGEVESSGVELEVRATLAERLNLIASYAYTDNEVTNSNNGTEGNRFGGVPEHAASLWADYRFTGALSGLNVGAGVRYQGETNNLANTYNVPSFTLVDAVVRYGISSWLLSLNISNLLDKEYSTCSYACFYGVERSAQFAATYRW